ncbi:hypothetical protein C7999DRAFT_17558 [Corynascus novoguineensis]|uniref:Uncharacterized protein n=1 Tax=Corynascus novoguineensis TaxID=1126955 RepID=A0AAN7CM50_9PEZI|nr:hypothetical protein C7999DRAFT_17558 [Corynascus novoguineensis]
MKSIYTSFFQCQQITHPGRIGYEVRKCVCIPGYDGWYPYLNTCCGYLPSTGTDDFRGNLGRIMTKLYSVCRDPAGNITSDGFSLCATEINYEECISPKDSSEGKTWVSFRGLLDGRSDNRMRLLSLAAVKANLTTSTTIEPAVSKMTATTAATELDTAASTTTPASETDSQVLCTTTGSQRITTTANPSFATRLNQVSQAGYVLRMLIVTGIAVELIQPGSSNLY